MRFSAAALVLLLSGGSAAAFAPGAQPPAAQHQHHTKHHHHQSSSRLHSAVEEAADVDTSASKTSDPLLIRAAKGQKTDRTPVWMSELLIVLACW